MPRQIRPPTIRPNHCLALMVPAQCRRLPRRTAMKKPLLRPCSYCCWPLSPAALSAQAGPAKAYAPGRPAQSVRPGPGTRVISLEYSEQSRGRRIPDDQLRFYLDQVNRSNWTFSRIKQDIATSLGGNDGGWNPNPPANGQFSACESKDNRRRECRTGFRGRAVLSAEPLRAPAAWRARTGAAAMAWSGWTAAAAAVSPRDRAEATAADRGLRKRRQCAIANAAPASADARWSQPQAVRDPLQRRTRTGASATA